MVYKRRKRSTSHRAHGCTILSLLRGLHGPGHPREITRTEFGPSNQVLRSVVALTIGANQAVGLEDCPGNAPLRHPSSWIRSGERVWVGAM